MKYINVTFNVAVNDESAGTQRLLSLMFIPGRGSTIPRVIVESNASRMGIVDNSNHAWPESWEGAEQIARLVVGDPDSLPWTERILKRRVR